MEEQNMESYENRVLTIPNLLSFFRLCLIPVIIWLYCVREDSLGTAAVLALSGLTDVVDGRIARRFHMVSSFGKALDPVAMLFCLVSRFPLMLVPLVILTVKEITAAVLNSLAIRKTGKVMGAVWHGKLNTVLLYTTLLIHLLWDEIPAVVSNISIGLCTVTMLISAVLYGIRSVRALMGPSEEFPKQAHFQQDSEYKGLK